MNHLFVFGCCLMLLSCASKNEKTVKPVQQTTHTTFTSDSNAAYANKDTATVTLPAIIPIKRPSGIYQFVLPYGQHVKIEHTIAFYNNTYRLQEVYSLGKKDSIVITQGTWAPSDGYIWLYKDQVAEGRYTWKGDTLQYFSPLFQKSFSMTKLTPVQENSLLMDKKTAGDILYGTGNGLAWSIELNKQDTLTFALPDASEPVKLKVSNISPTRDSIVYFAQADSLKLRVTVLPYFCVDGLGNFVYSNAMKVQYNGKTYTGCGVRFK